MNIFNENEFLEMCNFFKVAAYTQEISIKYLNSSFFNKMKKAIGKDRRGEVVFCAIRPNGKIITITCQEYPKGIFRIPTGGIERNENIIDAVLRETKEELGIEVEITKFIGVLKIKFEHEDNHVMFYSYMFILKELGGRLLLDASDDEISEVKEVDLIGLSNIVDSLNCITGKWADWGKFRYVTTNAILRYLKEIDSI